MDIIYEIRRRYSVQKQTVSAIAREMGLSRPTVRKHLNTIEEPKYNRKQPASPMLGQFEPQFVKQRPILSTSQRPIVSTFSPF